MTQGCPEASGLFCAGWHGEVVVSCLRCAAAMAKFANDDSYAMGPAAVFPTMLEFQRKVQDRHLLHLQLNKTDMFTRDSNLPPEAPPPQVWSGLAAR